MAIGNDPTLNPALILQGLSTTHPELYSDIMSKATASAAQLRQTQLEGQMVPSEIEKNQALAAINQANAMMLMRKYQGYMKGSQLMPKDDLSGNQSFVAPLPSTAAPGPTLATTPTDNGGSATSFGAPNPQATPAPASGDES